MYDVDCVDDQHSHGKSVGKYHMVNRVNEKNVHKSSYFGHFLGTFTITYNLVFLKLQPM